MLEEKTMVADALTGINGELMRFGEMIPQTDNKELQNHAETVKGRLRAVSGRAVSDRAGKILLRARCESHAGRSESRKEPVFR